MLRRRALPPAHFDRNVAIPVTDLEHLGYLLNLIEVGLAGEGNRQMLERRHEMTPPSLKLK